MGDLTIGHFPYAPGFNPYQRLFSEALESAGLDVVRIPNRKFFPIQYALSHPIDLLHMDWPHSFYVGRTWLNTRIKRVMYFLGRRKLKRKPFVWTAHNLVRHDQGRDDDILMVQKLIDCCDAVMVMSEAARAALLEMYRLPEGARVAVIPHGHYIDCYPNTVSREEARSRLEIDAASRVVLLLGRIQKYKGIDRLIDAFGEMAGEGDVLLIAGPAEDAGFVTELHDRARRRCPSGAEVRIQTEFIPDDRVQDFFQACDVAALPFRQILNSGSFMLAMSFGRCVVAPNMGSIPEIAYPDAFFGYDPDDPNGLRGAMGRALAQADLVARGNAAMDFARREYGWEDIGRKLRQLYESVLGRT